MSTVWAKVVQLVECLHGTHTTLGLMPNTTENKKLQVCWSTQCGRNNKADCLNEVKEGKKTPPPSCLLTTTHNLRHATPYIH